MNDKAFFYGVLGLSEPWQVEDMKLGLGGKKVEGCVAVKSGTKWAEHGKLLPIAGYEAKNWRHLDTLQLETVITARVRPKTHRLTHRRHSQLRRTQPKEGSYTHAYG